MHYSNKQELNKLLISISEELDISDSSYEQAESRYKAVGSWLAKEDSPLYKYEPEIYLQGSFRLGTVIKPITDEDEYDIDLVCELQNLGKTDITQKQLKEMVGDRLKANGNYLRMLEEEGQRCWSLNYAEQTKFHMDILPSIPEEIARKRLIQIASGMPIQWINDAVCITDNKQPTYSLQHNDWQCSNPKGYTEWFKERMKIIFKEHLVKVAKSLNANIESVPDYKVKTPLQRAVQILKRHRDKMFENDPDDKPISIIITTLSAKAYNNEASLIDTLLALIDEMPNYIEYREGIAWVQNPVNHMENFADKWEQFPQRETKFKSWLKQVNADLTNALHQGDINSIGKSLNASFGEEILNKSTNKILKNNQLPIQLSLESRALSRFDVSHKSEPQWPMVHSGNVDISGKIKYNGSWHRFSSDFSPLPKDCALLFTAKTKIKPPYKVYWQVVNTGKEAKHVNQLRGNIFEAANAGVGGLKQKEATAYSGEHWIECFIVKNQVCVARSGEFVVNIL